MNVTVPATGCVPLVQAVLPASEVATAPGVKVMTQELPALSVLPQVLLTLVPVGNPEEFTATLVASPVPVF